MGTIRGTRDDGSEFSLRITQKTKRVAVATENLVRIDLSAMGPTPFLTEMMLNVAYHTALETIDLAPLAHRESLDSLTFIVKVAPDLAPLKHVPLTRLSIDTAEALDVSPLVGHPTLTSLSIGNFASDVTSFDLSFVRTLPKLRSLDLCGGDWRELDLSPLAGLPLENLTLRKMYLTSVDLSCIAQAELRGLWLDELDLAAARLDFRELAPCKKLGWLSMRGAKAGTIDLTTLATLPALDGLILPASDRLVRAKGPIASAAIAKLEEAERITVH